MYLSFLYVSFTNVFMLNDFLNIQFIISIPEADRIT